MINKRGGHLFTLRNSFTTCSRMLEKRRQISKRSQEMSYSVRIKFSVFLWNFLLSLYFCHNDDINKCIDTKNYHKIRINKEVIDSHQKLFFASSKFFYYITSLILVRFCSFYIKMLGMLYSFRNKRKYYFSSFFLFLLSCATDFWVCGHLITITKGTCSYSGLSPVLRPASYPVSVLVPDKRQNSPMWVILIGIVKRPIKNNIRNLRVPEHEWIMFTSCLRGWKIFVRWKL